MASSIYEVFDNGSGTIVAVGANGLLWSSADGGGTWTIRNSGVSNALYGVAYSETFGYPAWVVVGENGLILTSSNLVTWQPRVSFTSQDLYGVAYNGVFLAVGGAGAFGLSDDIGVTWEAKDAGTLEDLLDITADLGAYLIVGTNDTIIIGDITSLEFDILVTEGVQLLANLADNANLKSTVTENLVVVTEESWLHDSLGGGTVLTQGGTNQFIFLNEEMILFDPAADQTGIFNHTITESITFLESGSQFSFSMSGDIPFPMFETSGVAKLGKLTSGDLTLPMFKTAGVIKLATGGEFIFPMFSTSGSAKAPSAPVGAIVFPMFYTSGRIEDISPLSDDYSVWVLNAESKHHSTYINWPVNSLATFNGENLVATADGIYRIAGDLDGEDSLEGKIYWAQSDLKEAQQKSIDCVFVRMRGANDDVKVVCVVDEVQVRNFPTPMTATPEGNYVRRIKFPRGLQGQRWQFGIESVGEGKLDLSEIEVITVPFKRRIK